MIMSCELLDCCKQIAALEAEIKVLDTREQTLCTKGNIAASSDVNALIEKCAYQKLLAYGKYQEQLKALIKAVLRAASLSENTSMTKLIHLQSRYFTMVNWLCEQRGGDTKDEQMTYWDRFRRDHPDANIWDYND